MNTHQNPDMHYDLKKVLGRNINMAILFSTFVMMTIGSFIMDILDMFMQIGSGFCFVVTMFTGETPNVVMNSIHMSLELWMVSSSEVTLATDKILNFFMSVLYVSIQILLETKFFPTVLTRKLYTLML